MQTHNERIEHVVGWLMQKREEFAATNLPADVQDALVALGGLLYPIDEDIASSESAATCSAASGRQDETAIVVSEQTELQPMTATCGTLDHAAPPLVEWRRTSRGGDLPDVWVASTQESLFDSLAAKEVIDDLKTEDGKPVLHCVRCGYYWTPRPSTPAEPKRCARCRSYLWNTPRTYRWQSKPDEPPMLKRKPTDSNK